MPAGFLSVRHAAERLGISRGYVYQLIDAEVLEAVRIALPGRRGVLRIEADALAAYLIRLREKPQRAPAVDPDAILRELRAPRRA